MLDLRQLSLLFVDVDLLQLLAYKPRLLLLLLLQHVRVLEAHTCWGGLHMLDHRLVRNLLAVCVPFRRRQENQMVKQR